VPILGDRFYGTATGEPEDSALDDWSRPLQLLAATLEFPDPLTGAPRPVHQPPGPTGVHRPEGWAASRLPDGPAQQVRVSSKE
jgi:tRNA pseudouridine32 synthase/23S rRNA pseudouridine746 synthase